MTKKHFEKLAANLKHYRPEPTDAEYVGWFGAVMAVIEICAEVNSAFDRNRFLDACGAVILER